MIMRKDRHAAQREQMKTKNDVRHWTTQQAVHALLDRDLQACHCKRN